MEHQFFPFCQNFLKIKNLLLVRFLPTVKITAQNESPLTDLFFKTPLFNLSGNSNFHAAISVFMVSERRGVPPFKLT